jgi:hypothetical protein
MKGSVTGPLISDAFDKLIRKNIKQTKKEFEKIDKPGEKQLAPSFEYPD